jgi:hypothetical protein
MKRLATFILGIALFSAITSVQAGGVRGYFRSNGTYVSPSYRSSYGSLGSSSGYVYRNPYAAYPSVSVRSYTKTDGTFVLPHYRTPANWTVRDNLSYRGYGTIRVPRF